MCCIKQLSNRDTNRSLAAKMGICSQPNKKNIAQIVLIVVNWISLYQNGAL
jgi:hypothetical protein